MDNRRITRVNIKLRESQESCFHTRIHDCEDDP